MKSEQEIQAEITRLRLEADLNAHGGKFNAPLALILEARKRGLEWVLELSVGLEPPIRERGQDEFHAHLDSCVQCRDRPFDLCFTGLRILQSALEKEGLLPHG